MATEQRIASTEEKTDKQHMSKGEKVFNWLVYGGIGYLFTFIITVPIAWALEYHPRMMPQFKRAGEWIGKTFHQSPEGARKLLQTFTLFVGGFLAVFPIWVAEQFKVPFVHHWNKTHNDKTDPDAIKEAPKQTWSTLGWGRVAAWSTVFISMFGGSKLFPKSFRTFETEFAEKFCKALGKSTHENVSTRLINQHTRLKGQIEAFDVRGKKPPKKLITAWEAVDAKLALKETTHFRVGRLAALDVFATAASATLLFLTSHMFAKRSAKHQQADRAHAAGDSLSDDANGIDASTSAAEKNPDKPSPKVMGGGIAAQKALANAADHSIAAS